MEIKTGRAGARPPDRLEAQAVTVSRAAAAPLR